MSTTRHLRDPGSPRRTRLYALRYSTLIRTGGPVPPGGLNLEPPSSCRDFVTAWLAAERAYSCPN